MSFIKRVVSLALTFAFLSTAQIAVSLERENDPFWKQFVTGKVSELPDGGVKDFLSAAHFNNPYAKVIAKLTKKLGPFAPEQDNVFWVPTIEVPMNKDNWRFLSSLNDMPKSILNLTTSVNKNGETTVRMFLHPFSVQEPLFIELAEKHGGFKYEFQGATTASVRSLIAWKVPKAKPEGASGELQFPKNEKSFLWPKVSITRADIDGSRLNPAKKMVRAYAVTRAMSKIPTSKKREIGFDFAGEWLVGVPKGSDAGFVTREVMPEFVSAEGLSVEPGFSVLSPKRLSELTKRVKNPETYIRDRLIRPIYKTVSYLMMEEGMLGEYHNQNFNYVIGKNGAPTGEILLHDADAFRTSILLRAMNGKETGVFRKVDAPFFYMKDSVFLQSGAAGEDYGLNALMNAYFSDPRESDSVAGFIKTWCQDIKAYEDWCNNKGISKMFLDTFSEELSPYVGYKIENLSLEQEIPEGKIGLVGLFKERMKKVSKETALYRNKPVAELQKILFKEYERLEAAGRAKSLSGSITLENSNFILESQDGNSVIHVISKDPEKGFLLKGIALPGLSDDKKSIEFAIKVKEVSGIEIAMDFRDGMQNRLLSRPWMLNMGGGSNIPKTVRDYIAQKEKLNLKPMFQRNCDELLEGFELVAVPRAPKTKMLK